MALEPESNPTKSVAWLSLTKETQENIITRFNDWNKPGISWAAEMQTNANFSNAIHNVLGTSRGYRDFMKDLEELSGFGGDAKGGIWDTIRDYIAKYRTIENAAKSIALQRDAEKVRQ